MAYSCAAVVPVSMVDSVVAVVEIDVVINVVEYVNVLFVVVASVVIVCCAVEVGVVVEVMYLVVLEVDAVEVVDVGVVSRPTPTSVTHNATMVPMSKTADNVRNRTCLTIIYKLPFHF